MVEMCHTPFGDTQVDCVLWKELSYLKESNREYVLCQFNEYCKTVGDLYRSKIMQRETLTELLYKHTIEKVSRYLTNDSYSYFCNVMRRNTRRYRRLDFKKKKI